MKFRILLLALLLTIITSNSSHACVMQNSWDCGGGALPHANIFDNNDENKDNRLSRSEYDVDLGLNDKIFNCTDINADGYITKEEFTKHEADCSNRVQSDEAFNEILEESLKDSGMKPVPFEDWNKQFNYEDSN